jgi:hypothetical protein
VLGITLNASTSIASTWTRYQNYKIHLDVPQNWRIERDLYGMPIMVLGPERNGERAVLSVQDTPVYGMEFDHKLLQKTKNQYYEGRKNWLEEFEDSKFLSEIPYRHLKWTNGNDGFEMGFKYEARGIELEERSIQINCNNRLFLFKTLTSNKIPESDNAVLRKLVEQLDCLATTEKDGPYIPSQLQDFDRKFKDSVSGTSPWPTKQQIKGANTQSKALMLEALVEFYKNFESSGGPELYSSNIENKKDVYFAKIKDRTDQILSILLPKSFAAENFDCFFGGWPSKFVKRNGITTCGYPWDTNPKYEKTGSNCGEGKMECNPSLFGEDVCVGVSNSTERSHATLSCEMAFRSSGKSYDDVVKNPDFDESNLEQTLESAKDVCSQDAYSSSNYGLCSTLKEKLGISINSGKKEEDESDVKFINGLEEMKPENFDEFVKATETNYKNFEARCIDEKGELKTEVENCLEDHLAILSDLEKIDKSAKQIQEELDDDQGSNVIKNNNCSKADCNTPDLDPIPQNNKSKIVEKDETQSSDPTACTIEQIKRKKERECSWSKGMFMAGSCVWNVLTSLVSSLWGTIKAIVGLIWDGVKWVGNKVVQGAKWFASLFGYEDASSKKVNTASQTSNSTINSFKKDPIGSAINFFKTIYDGIAEFVSTDIACEKWSGVAHFSTCLIPATSWKCQPCMDKVDTVCSSIGYITGEILPAFFTGGLTTALKGTAAVAKVTKYLSKASKMGKLSKLESKVLKVVKKPNGINKVTQKTAKYESKLLKTELGITGEMSKTQKLIGKIYNTSRWPVKKYNKIKAAYNKAKTILTNFKSKAFGKFDNVVTSLKNIRKKNFVYRSGSWIVNATVVKPLKIIAKVTSAPVRYPYKWTKKYVQMQAKVYKAGLKYGERKFNNVIVKNANMSRYPAATKNIVLYGSLSKYPYTGSHMLDEFRERLSMKDENNPSLFWKSSKEIEAQARSEGKNPEEVKRLLKKNRIDQLTNTLVMETLTAGKEPKEVDLQYLSKARGISIDDIRVESIDSRLQLIAEGTNPKFTQNDYNSLAKINKISPSEAKAQIDKEVQIQTASAKVVSTLDNGKQPSEEALQNLANVRNCSTDDIVIESVNRRILSALGGEKPVFSRFDYETWARVNGISVDQAKKEITAEVQDSQNMIDESTSETEANL